MAERQLMTHTEIVDLLDRLARDSEKRAADAVSRDEAAVRRDEAVTRMLREMAGVHREARLRDEVAIRRDEETTRMHREMAEVHREARLRDEDMTRMLREMAGLLREARLRDEAAVKSLEARSHDMDKWHVTYMEKLDRIGEMIGGVSRNTGKHAEAFFQNALEKTLTFGGVKFNRLLRNQEYQKSGSCEFDILLENCDSLALIEAKNRIHPSDLLGLTTKKVAHLRKFFPEYAKHRLYLGLAGFSFDRKVVEDARRLGVGIVRQDGDSVEEDAGELKVY